METACLENSNEADAGEHLPVQLGPMAKRPEVAPRELLNHHFFFNKKRKKAKKGEKKAKKSGEKKGGRRGAGAERRSCHVHVQFPKEKRKKRKEEKGRGRGEGLERLEGETRAHPLLPKPLLPQVLLLLLLPPPRTDAINPSWTIPSHILLYSILFTPSCFRLPCLPRVLGIRPLLLYK